MEKDDGRKKGREHRVLMTSSHRVLKSYGCSAVGALQLGGIVVSFHLDCRPSSLEDDSMSSCRVKVVTLTSLDEVMEIISCQVVTMTLSGIPSGHCNDLILSNTNKVKVTTMTRYDSIEPSSFFSYPSSNIHTL